MKEYLDDLKDRRQSHPISQADFDAWRSNIVSQQFLEDLEILALESAQNIHATDSNSAGLQAAKLNGVQDTVDYVVSWTPECLEGIHE